MNTFKNNKKQEKEGFVILVAVLTATVVVALGSFIAAIAVKELELSSSGRESQDAFYAADAALECALFHDFRVEQFGSVLDNTRAQVRCNNTPITTVIRDVNVGTPQQAPSDQNNSVQYFEVTFMHPDIESPNQAPYARVKVRKYDVGTINDRTIIESQGYNVRDATAPGRVQRALQVVY